MTSGEFTQFPVDSIIIPEDRQRSDMGDIEDLALSISHRGLINPIVIRRDGTLVAGERRLMAHRHLAFDTIAVQYTDELDPLQLQLIELEENVKRKSLTWQEHNNAIAQFHEISIGVEQDWSLTKTAEALNVNRRRIGEELLVHGMRKEGIEEVEKSPQFSTAANFAKRRAERLKADAVHSVDTALKVSIIDEDSDEIPDIVIPKRRATLLNSDFLEWASVPQDIPFNLIHCDFPYGIGINKIGQSSAKILGGYDDSDPEIYWQLLNTFVESQDNFIAPSAHLIFWFSMNFYSETQNILSEAGWAVNPFPLVWHRSDGAGIIPDANRYGRRTYETAFFCSRNDRKIVKAKANSYAGKTTKNFHMSEKPHSVLNHFFQMVVSDSTRMLDPTAGSGMAVKVAEELGATFALGIEKDEDFFSRALQNLELHP